MIWEGGAEEIFEMNSFFPGNPFCIKKNSSARPLNFFFPGECPTPRSLIVVPLGNIQAFTKSEAGIKTTKQHKPFKPEMIQFNCDVSTQNSLNQTFNYKLQ